MSEIWVGVVLQLIEIERQAQIFFLLDIWKGYVWKLSKTYIKQQIFTVRWFSGYGGKQAAEEEEEEKEEEEEEEEKPWQAQR